MNKSFETLLEYCRGIFQSENFMPLQSALLISQHVTQTQYEIQAVNYPHRIKLPSAQTRAPGGENTPSLHRVQLFFFHYKVSTRKDESYR